jgi:hypothetical protein
LAESVSDERVRAEISGENRKTLGNEEKSFEEITPRALDTERGVQGLGR